MRYDEGGTCLLICAWCAGGGLEINGHAGGARHGTIGALQAAHPYSSRHTRCFGATLPTGTGTTNHRSQAIRAFLNQCLHDRLDIEVLLMYLLAGGAVRGRLWHGDGWAGRPPRYPVHDIGANIAVTDLPYITHNTIQI